MTLTLIMSPQIKTSTKYFLKEIRNNYSLIFPDESDGLPFIDSEPQSEILIIRSIDPCLVENGKEHHTSKYELMKRDYYPHLVVRRGQPFRLKLNLSRPYNEEKDAISFIFAVDDEDKPTCGHGTLVAIPLLKKPEKSMAWNAVLEAVIENTITVNVIPSYDCIVGIWRMEVDTKIINDGAYSYAWETKIYMLFNPWCKNDVVYMKDDLWRDETVLTDVGLIWRGTSNRLRPCIWKYSQFEKDILDCSLYLIHIIGKVHGTARSDPVRVSRAIAASVNSVDDNGAVVGNWSENFSGGTAPTKWVGSLEILQKFWKKKKPVKYGQCWVFSGVLTTST